VIRAALAAVVLAALAASSAGGRASVGSDYWLVLSSNRDGQQRAYSMRPDGSRLTPLLGPERALTPAGTSSNGRLVAYTDTDHEGGIYVSRADGSGLRRLVRQGDFDGFSPDGKLVAYGKGDEGAVWVVGTDGRGRRHLTTIDDDGSLEFGGPEWSPDSKAVVIATLIDRSRWGLVVQPLHGKRRVLVRSGPAGESDFAGIDSPDWSPDGRWIAFVNGENAARRNGLWLVDPNGRRLHRLQTGFADIPVWSPDGTRLAYLTVDEAGDTQDLRVVDPAGGHRRRFAVRNGVFDWSPDGTKLAYENGDDIVVADVDGPGSTRVRLGGLRFDWFVWSPDGRQLLLQEPLGGQIWAVGSDGNGLRRLTSEGANSLAGWTPLAPLRPPAPPIPPTEQVVGADSVATTAPVAFLAADGGTVAFIPQATPTDCDHVAVWMPAAGSVTHLGLRMPCGPGDNHVYDIAVAGSRIAWSSGTEVTVKSPTLDRPVEIGPFRQGEDSSSSAERPDFHVRGDGDLLVYSDGSRLVRIGVGGEKCGDLTCTTLTSGRDAHVCCPDSVSGRLIALREPGAVTVLDAQGKLVRTFPFALDDVSAARLDGERLVVWRFGRLEVYDVGTGAPGPAWPVPAGYRLADVDGGLVVLTSADRVEVLGLHDGRSFTLPGGEPTLADLEPPGLYYSYATADGGGRIVFVPRAEILRRLGGVVR
jgi:Tol biopolymer transport system component